MLLSVLSGLAWMLQILTMLKFLMNYGINIGGFLGLTLLMLPFIVSIIMPFVIFIALIFVYNKSISDNEITVMASAGISPRRIARPGIMLAVFLALVHWGLNLWVVPSTQADFYKTQWEMRYGLAHLKLQESAFTELADNLVVFVDKVSGSDLSQMMLFDNRDPRNQMTIMAEKGKLINTARSLSVVMTNGSLQMRGNSLTTGTFDSFDMDMNLAEKGDGYSFKVRRLSTNELMKYTKELKDIGPKRAKLVMGEITNRFLGPCMNIILALICMIFLLKMPLLRRRASMAAPYAVIGMACAMSLFMTCSNFITGMTGVYITGAIQLITICLLYWVLAKK